MKPGAGRFAVGGKWLKQPAGDFRREPGAGIFDLGHHLRFARQNSDDDLPTAGHQLRGVVKKVEKDMGELFPIQRDECLFRKFRALDSHRSPFKLHLHVVDEFFDGSIAQCLARWADSHASVEAIADRYRNARATAASWLDSPDVLVDRARAAQAQGVVLWLIEEDEGIVWEVPRQIERLRAAGIDVLALTRQSWNADSSVLRRICEFAQRGVA